MNGVRLNQATFRLGVFGDVVRIWIIEEPAILSNPNSFAPDDLEIIISDRK